MRYSEFVRVHAREHGLDPALLAAVIYQESKFRPSAKSSSGAIGLMQLTPATAKGIALRTGRARVPDERSVRPRDQHPLRRVVPRQPLQEVRRRTARARGLQCRPGKRRPLACEQRADSVRRDPRVRRARRRLEVHLSERVALEAVSGELSQCRHSSNSQRTPTRTRRSGRPTSASSTTATSSGWGAATSPAGTSRSAFGSRPTSSRTCATEIHAHLRAKGRTALHLGGRHARDSGRPRRPVTRARARRRRADTARRRHGADRAAGAAAARRRGPSCDDRRRASRGGAHRCGRVRRADSDRASGRSRARSRQRRLPRLRRR